MSDGRVIPVKVTESVPIAVDDATPIAVDVTNNVTVDSVSNPVPIDDSTPIDVNITGGTLTPGDVTSKDFLFAVSNGEVPGHSVFSLYGANDDIDTGTVPEDIKALGGLFDWPTTAEPLTIVSSDPNDAAGGTGAQQLRLVGLDANWDEITEFIFLGVGSVTTVNSFIRLNDARVIATGTYHGSNIGDITIIQQTSGDEMAIIPEGDGVKNAFRFTVPNGKTAHLLQTTVAISRGSGSISNGASYKFRSYIRADDVTGPSYGSLNTQLIVNGIRGQIQYTSVFTSVIPAKTDLWVQVFDVTQDNSSISCSGLILTIDN